LGCKGIRVRDPERRLAVRELSKSRTPRTAGLDLGDRFCTLCVLDEEGEVDERGRLATHRQDLSRRFEGKAKLRVALEAGTHSN